MVSKNTIALVLTINLVFFGFTAAQAPGPQAPTCPRDLQACANVLGINLFLNIRNVRPCCTLVAGLDTSVASVCICNALKINILGDTLTIRLGLLNRIFSLCGNSQPPADFVCA